MRTKGTIAIDPPLLIKYTSIPSPNIYYTDDNSHVSHNCDFLGFDLEDFKNIPHGIDVHHYHTYIVYTSKMDWKYNQHIFLKPVNKKFIREFVQTIPREAKELLTEIAGL